MPVVLLIRHAQASFGTTDYDVLSERGREQVEVLHRSLARRGIIADRVVTGSLRRQRDTAAPSGGARSDATIDERWNEYDDDDVLSHYSDTPARLETHAGTDGASLSSRAFQVLLDAALERWVEAGESGRATQTWPQFLAQINGALEDLAGSLRSGQTGLVFSSSGVIAALAASLIGRTDQTFVALNRVSVNTAITKVIVGRKGNTLVSYNEHSHLEGLQSGLVTYR